MKRYATYTLFFPCIPGTTIDACQAVVDKSSSSEISMKGVVCLSFLTNEFIREEWSQTENSYWFLIKRNGKIYIPIFEETSCDLKSVDLFLKLRN